MSVASGAAAPADRSEMMLLLQQFREDALRLTLPGFLVAGILLTLNEARFDQSPQVTVPGLFLFLCPLLVYLIQRKGMAAAGWALTLGWLTAIALVILWSGVSAAIPLLALPVGLAVLFLGLGNGLGIAAVISAVVVLAPHNVLPVDPILRYTSLFGVWTTAGLVWLSSHPLEAMLQWSWGHYRQSRTLLERARDYQVQLKQALADLAEANLQLRRLNHLAQGLRQAADEARRTKEQFVANVSHEFRTPLNMIIGFGEMILQAPKAYGKVPPALLVDLAVIVRNSQHLSRLIDDVLDLSQIEAEQMALTRDRVSFREILAAAVTAVRPLFSSKGLYLKTEMPEDVTIHCDRTRIHEVLLNLLSNAGRFTSEGGVCVRAWREGEDLVVSVADTGPGISPDDQNRLFRPFQQLDPSLRRRYGGTGLGLAISKSFVELHGGKMWVESQEGCGATFVFRLPIEPPPLLPERGISRWFNPHWHYEERPERRPVLPRLALRPRYVVLDPNRALARLIDRYRDGAEVVRVESVEQALAEVTQTPAQALLINSSDAVATLQQLQSSGPLPHGLPVLACSLPGPVDAADALGASDYLVKPVSRETLLNALERLHLRGKTILIVDDEPEARQLFRRMLVSTDAGYRVLTAANGQEALTLLREQQPDAVLVDLVMPEMDGFRLLEARRQDASLRQIPFIILSARDPAGEPIVSDLLVLTRGGGFSPTQVLATIEAVCGGLTRGNSGN